VLIIFMIVTPAITAGSRRRFRAQESDAREEGEARSELGIDREGSFYIYITGASGKYTRRDYISDEDLQVS